MARFTSDKSGGAADYIGEGRAPITSSRARIRPATIGLLHRPLNQNNWLSQHMLSLLTRVALDKIRANPGEPTM